MGSGALSSEELQTKSIRFAAILVELNEKGERWLTLSIK
jgi:hypothetical protein